MNLGSIFTAWFWANGFNQQQNMMHLCICYTQINFTVLLIIDKWLANEMAYFWICYIECPVESIEKAGQQRKAFEHLEVGWHFEIVQHKNVHTLQTKRQKWFNHRDCFVRQNGIVVTVIHPFIKHSKHMPYMDGLIVDAEWFMVQNFALTHCTTGMFSHSLCVVFTRCLHSIFVYPLLNAQCAY